MGDIEQRIVALYRTGCSIEAITREVGRARHLVVHILHTTGVFGTVQTEPCGDEPASADFPVQESSSEAPQPDPVDMTAGEIIAAPKKSVTTIRRVKRAKPAEDSPTPAAAAPSPTPPAVEAARAAGKWSPQVVEALFKVVTQSETDPGMSVEDLRKMVTKPRRSSRTSQG
ncbi:MAG: hypothetical protein AB9873_18150 [Syntrophobacteraceae bacterium]